jgi:dolichol-phosphate mannosyltransferase
VANGILVAIPCYQCATQIGRTLAGFQPDLLARVDRVVCIDNGSTDGTEAAALDEMRRLGFGSRGWVIRNDRNYGLGGTHKVAFELARAERFAQLVILHGDAQGRTEEIGRFIDEAARHPEASAILGARFMPGSTLEGYPLLRQAGNRGLNLVYSALTGQRILDMGAGLNLFRVSLLERLPYREFSDAFTFNMDLLLELLRRREPFRYVPITWTETDQRSNASALRVGWKALTTVLRWRFGPEARSTPGDPSREGGGYTWRRIESALSSSSPSSASRPSE